MKKLKIGLFSLFALTAGGTAVISAIPVSAIAAPMPYIFGWLAKIARACAEVLNDLGDLFDLIEDGPGKRVQPKTVNMSSLISNKDLLASYSAERISLSTTRFYTARDFVVINDSRGIVVIKAGDYKIDQRGRAILNLDIFKPIPTFPKAGTLID